jgi:PAS domain S-box-containing protein
MKSTLNVLIIEDSPNDAELILHEISNRYIAKHVVVDNAHDLKRALSEKLWDLVLCDYSMPDFDPYRALTILREYNMDIPLIVISGVIGEENAIRLLHAGCRDCVMKSNLSRLPEVMDRELKEAGVRKQNRELNKKLQRYQILADEANEAMLFLDLEGNILDANVSATRIYGYSFEEIQTLNISDLIREAHKGFNGSLIKTAFERGLTYETVHYRKNGSSFNVETSLKGTMLEGEKIVLNILRDITERKIIEHELQQSEEKFQLLFEKAPLGYQSLDFEGRLLDVNQKWLDTLGYTKEEVIGKWFGDFLCPEHVEGFRQRFPIFKAQGHIHCELEIRSKDGQRLFIAFEGKVANNEKGEFKQTHCILLDITDQRKAEKALIESEKKYSSYIESAPNAVFVIDKNGRYLDANKTATLMTGYSREELLKMNWMDLTADESKDHASELFGIL